MKRSKRKRIHHPLQKAVTRAPLPVFFLLAFFISWTCWFLASIAHAQLFLILGSYGPALSAMTLAFVREGWRGMAQTIKKLGDWRHGWRWYAFGIFSTYLVIKIPMFFLPLPQGSLAVNAGLPLFMIPLVFAYVLVFSVIGEEVGWRGYALPLLLKKHDPLPASLILGFLWGAWHLPLFFLPGNFHQWIPFPWFFLQSIGLTLVMTYLYGKTNGSLLMACLFHTASNVTIGLMPVLPTAADPDLTLLKGSIAALYLLILALAWLERKPPKRTINT